MSFTYKDLIDEASGLVNTTALRSMIRRRAMNDYGAVCPRSIRLAGQFYRSHIAAQQDDWKSRHGVARLLHDMPADLTERLDATGVRREV